MIATLMVYTLVVSVLIVVGARGLEEACRATGLPTRFVWVAALLGTLALAALAPARATLSDAESGAAGLELSAVAGDPAAGPPDGSHGVAGGLRGPLTGIEAALTSGVKVLRHAARWPLDIAASSSSGSRAGVVLGTLWLALSLILLLLSAGTVLRYRAARRRWPVREIAGTLVRVSPSAGPAVLGLLRPEIVVPEWLLAKEPSEQRLVALHEREHLRARDGLTLAAGWLTVALVPWNPFVWWMLWRLRLAVELDCDARVLRRGVRPGAYGSMLIDMAAHGSGLSLGVPALAGSPSTLERRLTAMTTPFSRMAAIRAAGLGALGALTLLAACAARMPTSVEVDELDVAGASAEEASVQDSRATEVPSSFAMVVDATGPGVTAICEEGCAWEKVGATFVEGRYRITELGIHPVRGDEQPAAEESQPGGFSVVLIPDGEGVSAACVEGCAWNTVSAAFPTSKYRITQDGIEQVR